MDDTYFPYSLTVKAFQSSYPEIKVRIDRILDQHRYISIPESFGDFLHKERIGRCAGSEPDHIHPVLEALEYVLLARNLGTYLET